MSQKVTFEDLLLTLQAAVDTRLLKDVRGQLTANKILVGDLLNTDVYGCVFYKCAPFIAQDFVVNVDAVGKQGESLRNIPLKNLMSIEEKYAKGFSYTLGSLLEAVVRVDTVFLDLSSCNFEDEHFSSTHRRIYSRLELLDMSFTQLRCFMFVDLELPKIDLKNSDLNSAVFVNCTGISNVLFDNARFKKTIFVNTDIPVSLTEDQRRECVELKNGCSLRDICISKVVSYKNVSLKDSTFVNVSFTQFFPRDLDLSGTRFKDCTLLDVRVLSGSTLLENTTFDTCVLKNVSLSETRIKNTKFKNSVIDSCYLNRRTTAPKNSITFEDCVFENINTFNFSSTCLKGQDLKASNITHIWNPIQDSDFSYVDAKNVKFDMYSLDNVDFTGANLSGANFMRVTRMSHTKFLNADVSGTFFSAVAVDGKNILTLDQLASCFIVGPSQNLRGACFTGKGLADFTNLDFSKSDLSRANFSKEVLISARFEGSNLTDADFTKCKLDMCSFTEADASFSDFTDAEISKGHLRKTVFKNAKMARCVFSCTLTDINFKGADLSFSRFSGDLTKNNFGSSKLDFAVFDKLPNKCSFKSASMNNTVFFVSRSALGGALTPEQASSAIFIHPSATINNADLKHVHNIKDRYISQSYLDNVTFDTLHFFRFVCVNTRFENCSFKDIVALDVKFVCCTFENCTFEGAQFEASTFRQCTMNNVYFDKVLFKNTDFEQCYATNVVFDNKVISRGAFSFVANV